LVNKNKAVASRKTVIPSNRKFFKDDKGNQGIFWWELGRIRAESVLNRYRLY
jgi:hypothetical protein